MYKYAWSFNEDAEIYMYGEDSIEECIQEARRVREEEKIYKGYIYIGETSGYKASIDGETILDGLIETGYNDCGEVAENWDFDHLESTAIEELEDDLTAVLDEWLKKWNVEPNFYMVENVKEYSLEESEQK